MVSCRADSITWDMVAKEAETGKAYLHEHKDVNGQPVIVIRSSLHVTGILSVAPCDILEVASFCFSLTQLSVLYRQYLGQLPGYVAVGRQSSDGTVCCIALPPDQTALLCATRGVFLG